MDMAWNAYKMAEDIGDRIADATSPQNPALEHPPRFGGGSAPSGCSVSESTGGSK